MDNDSSVFHQFNSPDELNKYILRPEKEYVNEIGKYNFEQCEFNFDVKFSSILKKFEGIAFFKNATFNNSVSFEGLTFENVADFNGCIFRGHTSFENVHFEEEVTLGRFNSSVSFKNAHFKSNSFFPKQFRKSVDFSFCHFYQDLDLSDRKFHDIVYFNDAIFDGIVHLEDSTFYEKVNAWKTIFNNDLRCKWTNFKGKLNLTESSIKKGFSNFYGTNFESNAYFYNTIFKKLDLKNSVIEKGVYFLGAIIKKTNRETNRIIKNQFLKQNNRIESLKYHHKEMITYLHELCVEIGENFIKAKPWAFLKNIGDLFILIINFISNGFGLWWFQGIIFLFITTTIIFYFYLNNIQTFSEITYLNLDYWKYYLQFITPTHKFEFIQNAVLTDKAYIIDYFGRVISTFGIYQLVQAFRKYGKF